MLNLVDEGSGGVSSVMFDVTMKGTRYGGGYHPRLPRPGASVTADPLLEVSRSGARQMLHPRTQAP